MLKVPRRLFWLGLLPVLLLSEVGRAASPPVIGCPWYSPTTADNFAVRGFYVASYPGTTLNTVELILYASAPGSYTLSLTARLASFNGTLVGTAATPMTFSNTAPVQVTFSFGNVSVPAGSTVTFQGSVVGPSTVFMEVVSSTACLVLETEGTDSPLSTFRRQSVAVNIHGELPTTFAHSVTVPAVANIHGVNNAFFHTDAWLHSSDVNTLSVTATYYCYATYSSCGSGPLTFSIDPGTGKSYSDVVGTVFGAPDTAGAIVFRYSSTSSNNTLKVLTRTYSPSLPNPTNGASVPGVPFTSVSGKWTFVGLGNNGGDRSAGFRTNAGVFNSFSYPATVTFHLTTASGVPLGSVTQTWAAHEARQNEIFGTVGAGSVITTDAILTVVSDIPVFAYVTVIDNQTQDSVIQ